MAPSFLLGPPEIHRSPPPPPNSAIVTTNSKQAPPNPNPITATTKSSTDFVKTVPNLLQTNPPGQVKPATKFPENTATTKTSPVYVKAVPNLPQTDPPGQVKPPTKFPENTATTKTSPVFVETVPNIPQTDPPGRVKLPTKFPEKKSPPVVALPKLTPCLNFFFNVTANTASNELGSLLSQAWVQDPETTLKLICHLGLDGVDGKPNKEGFSTAVLWLHWNHPVALDSNLAKFASFGYLKYFPEILYRILKGELENKREGESRSERRQIRAFYGAYYHRSQPREKSVKKKLMDNKKAKALRKKKDMARARRAVKIYQVSFRYQSLHNCVADLFAKMLKSDIEMLKSGQIEKISMASKWCPSINSLYDKRTLICESIAKRIFPLDSCPEYTSIQAAHYAYRVRNRLMKEVLVPLRKALKGTKRGELVQHKPVVSVTLRRLYAGVFADNEKERFKAYARIAAKIGSGRSMGLPHRIVAALEHDKGREGAESKWKVLVERSQKSGKLGNCLAICGVSKSMTDTQRNICLSMGLLISELGNEPWKGKVVSFCDRPKLCEIQGCDLASKIEFIRKLEYTGKVNIQAVFDQVAEFAVAKRISGETMVKKIFVFCDMGFREVSMSLWGMWGSFRKRGFMRMPEIVLWNLRDDLGSSLGVAKQNGVSMVNGSSDISVAALLEGGVVPTLEDLVRSIPKPEYVLESAISGDLYNNLFV